MKRKALILLVSLLFVLGFSFSSLAERVKLKTPDGTIIKCEYFRSQVQEQKPAIVILPGLGGISLHRTAYYSFAKQLNKKYAYNVLIVGYRAKDSKMIKIIKKQKAVTFIEQEVTAAFDYLQGQENVDRDKIGLVGFSYGTVLSVMTAGRENSVKALTLISLILPKGGDKFHSEFPQEFARGSVKPVFFLADEKDNMRHNKSNAAANARYWSQQAKSDVKVEITKLGYHSGQYFSSKAAGGKKYKEMIGDWFQKYLK